MSINSKEFNKEYYYNICFGSSEFKQSNGKKISYKIQQMINTIPLNKDMNVLEIGCGRGDTAIYVCKKVNSVTGVDYSPAAIAIANKIKKNFSKKIQRKVRFVRMSADKLKFKDNTFDAVLMIDTIDHLNNNELNKSLKEISRVLKLGGIVYIKTCSNNSFLDKTYKYYIYPMNRLLTKIDKIIKNINYEPLPKNPRTREQSKQHINEPTYFYLKKIFRKYGYTGKINVEKGYLKEGTGLRTKMYNFLISFYPLSLLPPFSYFFASSFFCVLRNTKQISIK